jgi:hypothetical protein
MRPAERWAPAGRVSEPSCSRQGHRGIAGCGRTVGERGGGGGWPTRAWRCAPCWQPGTTPARRTCRYWPWLSHPIWTPSQSSCTPDRLRSAAADPDAGPGIPAREPVLVDATMPGRVFATGHPIISDYPPHVWLPFVNGTERLGVLEGLSRCPTRRRRCMAWVPRTRADVERFFDGWKLIEPGLGPVMGWRPAGEPPPTT